MGPCLTLQIHQQPAAVSCSSSWDVQPQTASPPNALPNVGTTGDPDWRSYTLK